MRSQRHPSSLSRWAGRRSKLRAMRVGVQFTGTIARGLGHLKVVIGSDHALWHKWQVAPNDGWSGWASLGGWIDHLAVGYNADGRLEVFARGSDGALWHKWQTAPNNGWSGWASQGGWIDLLAAGQNVLG
jgi:uncharacterized protein GlcG (DUF336 family)